MSFCILALPLCLLLTPGKTAITVEGNPEVTSFEVSTSSMSNIDSQFVISDTQGTFESGLSGGLPWLKARRSSNTSGTAKITGTWTKTYQWEGSTQPSDCFYSIGRHVSVTANMNSVGMAACAGKVLSSQSTESFTDTLDSFVSINGSGVATIVSELKAEAVVG